MTKNLCAGLMALTMLTGTPAFAHEAIDDMKCTSADGQIRVEAKPLKGKKEAYRVVIKKADKEVLFDGRSELLSRDLMKGETHGDQFDFTLAGGGTIDVWADHDKSVPRKGQGRLRLKDSASDVEVSCQIQLHL